MNSPIFKVAPQVKSSFFQRLFKQKPIDNAIIEVNNLLATREILSIDASELKAIEDNYNLNLLEEYLLNLYEFYAVLWNYYVKNNDSPPSLLNEINHLADLFKLPSEQIKILKDQIGGEYYRKSVVKIVIKRRMLSSDVSNLDLVAKHLQLDAEITAKIIKEEQHRVVKSYINNLSQKSRCSPDESMEAERMFDSFQVSASLRKELSKQLHLFLAYWEAEHLPLKTFEVTAGTLQKSEICYYFADRVKWYETRNGRYGVKELELINEGELYLTNKRLFFLGKFKNSQITFDRIVNVLKDKQNVNVIKDKGKHPTLKLGMDSELLSIILNRVRRGYFN